MLHRAIVVTITLTLVNTSQAGLVLTFTEAGEDTLVTMSGSGTIDTSITGGTAPGVDWVLQNWNGDLITGDNVFHPSAGGLELVFDDHDQINDGDLFQLASNFVALGFTGAASLDDGDKWTASGSTMLVGYGISNFNNGISATMTSTDSEAVALGGVVAHVVALPEPPCSALLALTSLAVCLFRPSTSRVVVRMG